MKRRAKKAYKLWQENSLHPSLHFKKVGKKLWSVRISGGYRALALKEGDDYYWIWIGEHNGYVSLSIEKKDYLYSLVAITSLDRSV
jgi:hypothetical protein